MALFMPVEIIAFDIGGVLANIDKSPVYALCAHKRALVEDFFDKDFTALQRGHIDSHAFFYLKSTLMGV